MGIQQASRSRLLLRSQAERKEHVIIGNGVAGVTAAETLRAADPSCSITIVADDPYPVYYRPGLKDFLGGRMPEEKLWARPATFYTDTHIRFIHGRVAGIDTLQHGVLLQNGKHIGYSKLLLANGARPRQISCPGLNLAGVSTLRTVADYQAILRRLSDIRRVVICGSGTLALESAETLRYRGYEVIHLMRGDTLWSEVRQRYLTLSPQSWCCKKNAAMVSRCVPERRSRRLLVSMGRSPVSLLQAASVFPVRWS